MERTRKEVYNVKEIQEILGIGKNKSYELCLSGKFPFRRIGKTIIIPKKTFEEWLYKQDQ